MGFEAQASGTPRVAVGPRSAVPGRVAWGLENTLMRIAKALEASRNKDAGSDPLGLGTVAATTLEECHAPGYPWRDSKSDS